MMKYVYSFGAGFALALLLFLTVLRPWFTPQVVSHKTTATLRKEDYKPSEVTKPIVEGHDLTGEQRAEVNSYRLRHDLPVPHDTVIVRENGDTVLPCNAFEFADSSRWYAD